MGNKPKFDITQPLYFKAGDEIKKLTSISVKLEGDTYMYFTNIGRIAENDLYVSRETLIDAQIKHWESLRGEKE